MSLLPLSDPAIKTSRGIKLQYPARRYSEGMRPIIALLCFALLISPLAAAEPIYHLLAKGETIYGLAREYKVSPESILKANNISDPTKLKVGQRLLIPRTHTVQKGETVFSIAKLYSITVETLRSSNGLSASALIQPGQVLILPAAAIPPKAKTEEASGAAAEGKGSGESSPGSSPASTKPSGSPVPAFPPLIKTSSKDVDEKLSWPCSGDARYLDGKLEGVMILAELGAPSVSVAGGRVVFAGIYRGYGEVAFIESKSGYIYVYGGNSSLEVKAGDTIRAGQRLGKIGYDAKEGRPVAYFFVFRDGDSLDPAKAPRG